jgi:CheY-like chemotaxis protein
MKILAMEANTTVRNLMVEFFEDCGHEIVGCKSLAEALPLVEKQHFEGAILSYTAGHSAGHVLLKKLRDSSPDTQVVVIAEEAGRNTLRILDGVGIEHVVTGDYQLKDLLAILSSDREGSQELRQQRLTLDEDLRLTLYAQVDPNELKALKQVLMADPDNDHAQWLLAFCYYRAGKYRDAVYLLEEIVAARAEDMLPRYYLGICYLRADKPAEAKNIWKKILEKDPDGPLAEKVELLMRRAEQEIAEI